MKKRIASLAVLLLLLPIFALGDILPEYQHTWQGKRKVASYQSDTLCFTIEKQSVDRTYVYVTKLWMADPGRQIRKSMGIWRESLQTPKRMMQAIPECMLAINGSGYISPAFPTLEEGYIGESEDYYYTSLGSIAITDGVVLRRMDEVPFYGLTLEADGLHMWNGVDNAVVMAGQPTQAWGFWHKCTLIEDGKDVLDRENWSFAQARAARTIIGKVDQNNYLLLTVERDMGSSHGMKLTECVDFLMENFSLEWAYNLDGGPSTALLCRKTPKKPIRTICGGDRRDFDLMGFVE